MGVPNTMEKQTFRLKIQDHKTKQELKVESGVAKFYFEVNGEPEMYQFPISEVRKAFKEYIDNHSDGAVIIDLNKSIHSS